MSNIRFQLISHVESGCLLSYFSLTELKPYSHAQFDMLLLRGSLSGNTSSGTAQETILKRKFNLFKHARHYQPNFCEFSLSRRRFSADICDRFWCIRRTSTSWQVVPCIAKLAHLIITQTRLSNFLLGGCTLMQSLSRKSIPQGP